MSLGYRPGARQPKGLGGPRVPGLMAPKKQQQQQQRQEFEVVSAAPAADEVSLDGPMSLDSPLTPETRQQPGSREGSPAGQDSLLMPNFQQYRERLQQRKEKLLAQKQQRLKPTESILNQHKAIEAGGNVSTSQTIVAAPAAQPDLSANIMFLQQQQQQLVTHQQISLPKPSVVILPAEDAVVETARKESAPAIDYRAEFGTELGELKQRFDAALVTIDKLQAAVDNHDHGLPGAAEFDKRFKEINFQIQDIILKQRQEMLDRQKMDVSIRSIQQDLVYFRKAAHNPELFQEDIRRQLKTTEESLYNVVTDKSKDVESQINAILGQMETMNRDMYSEFKDLIQLQHNASFWSFGVVVADGAVVYKKVPQQAQEPTSFDDGQDATALDDLEDDVVIVEHQDIEPAQETVVSQEPLTQFAVGQKVYVEHPMIKHEQTGDIWIRTKFVDQQGTVRFGYVQVYVADKQCRIISDFSIS